MSTRTTIQAGHDWAIMHELIDDAVLLECVDHAFTVDCRHAPELRLWLLPDLIDAIARLHAAKMFPHQQQAGGAKQINAKRKGGE